MRTRILPILAFLALAAAAHAQSTAFTYRGELKSGSTPPCPADFNHDGNLDADDLGDFITCYFSVPPCLGTDFNRDGHTDADDLGDLITTYFGPPC